MSLLDAFVSNVLSAADSPSAWAVGTIKAVAVGGAVDGNALVTVTWQGADVFVPYGSHYTPVVGHVVLMARFGPQLAVVCRLVGIPA